MSRTVLGRALERRGRPGRRDERRDRRRLLRSSPSAPRETRRGTPCLSPRRRPAARPEQRGALPGSSAREPLRRMRSKRSRTRRDPSAVSIDRPTPAAIAGAERALRQGAETVERDDLGAEPCKQRRHVAAAGADLEHPLPLLNAEGDEHVGDGAGRRHRLAAGQRQGHVGARQIGEAARREHFARYELHRPQQRHVADAARAQREDERRRPDRLGLGPGRCARPPRRIRRPSGRSAAWCHRSGRRRTLRVARQRRLVGHVEAQRRDRDAGDWRSPRGRCRCPGRCGASRRRSSNRGCRGRRRARRAAAVPGCAALR